MKIVLTLFLGAGLTASTVLNLAFTFAPEAMTRAVLHMFTL